MHKEYELRVTREYTTRVILKFPDDGRNHKTTINDKVLSGDLALWDYIAVQELEQMDIAHEEWEINELKQQ
jgi:hypothetical protein